MEENVVVLFYFVILFVRNEWSRDKFDRVIILEVNIKKNNRVVFI